VSSSYPQGMEHQSSAIPADWHQPGEGAGSAAAAAPGHVRVTLDTEPPLSRESSSSSDAGSSVSPWAGTWEAAGLYLRLVSASLRGVQNVWHAAE